MLPCCDGEIKLYILDVRIQPSFCFKNLSARGKNHETLVDGM